MVRRATPWFPEPRYQNSVPRRHAAEFQSGHGLRVRLASRAWGAVRAPLLRQPFQVRTRRTFPTRTAGTSFFLPLWLTSKRKTGHGTPPASPGLLTWVQVLKVGSVHRLCLLPGAPAPRAAREGNDSAAPLERCPSPAPCGGRGPVPASQGPVAILGLS